jgi:hypothetical protein
MPNRTLQVGPISQSNITSFIEQLNPVHANRLYEPKYEFNGTRCTQITQIRVKL